MYFLKSSSALPMDQIFSLTINTPFCAFTVYCTPTMVDPFQQLQPPSQNGQNEQHLPMEGEPFEVKPLTFQSENTSNTNSNYPNLLLRP